MTQAELINVVRGAVGGVAKQKAREQNLVTWDDLRRARRDINPGELEAAVELSRLALSEFLEIIQDGDATTIATMSLLIMPDSLSARAWVEAAPPGPILELGATAWLRTIAETWRSQPDPSKLHAVVMALDARLGEASSSIWWRSLCLGPRLEHVAGVSTFLRSLYTTAATCIARHPSLPPGEELGEYCKESKLCTSLLGRLMSEWRRRAPDVAARAEIAFWHHVWHDVRGELELGISRTIDRIYFESVSFGIRCAPDNLTQMVQRLLTGMGRWTFVPEPVQETNAAWLVASACLSLLAEPSPSSDVSARIVEFVLHIFREHARTLFWEPIGGIEMRATLAGLFARVVMLYGNPMEAPNVVLALAREVNDANALRVVIERVADVADQPLRDELDRMLAERSSFEEALAENPDGDGS
jgi:hypothetical protein